MKTTDIKKTEQVSKSQIAGTVLTNSLAENLATYVSKAKTIVVYNHLSLEAIIAAGELKKRRTGFMVIPANQILPKVIAEDNFIWIGVSPDKMAMRSLRLLKNNHQFYSSHDPMPVDETGYQITLIERICVDHNIRYSSYLSKLSFLVSKFYNLDAKIEDLAYVYAVLKENVAVLNDSTSAIGDQGTQVTEYLKETEAVKKMLECNYQFTKTIDGSTTVRVLLTHFSDYHFAVALRLIKLAYGAFLNYSVGSNGPLVYTSLLNPKYDDDLKVQPILMN